MVNRVEDTIVSTNITCMQDIEFRVNKVTLG